MKLKDIIEYLQSIQDKNPNLEAETDIDEYCAEMFFYYTREENNEEYADRIKYEEEELKKILNRKSDREKKRTMKEKADREKKLETDMYEFDSLISILRRIKEEYGL